MPLEAPNLDDRRFDQIVQELQSLIPRYTPEWTDLNASDPGITLIQLFAWLGEMILFRLNRVPDRNYLKFLELLGIQPQPAMPATALLTFTLVSPDAGPVLIPSRTRVGAAAPPPASGATASPTLPAAEEEPVVFETEEPLMALGATLQKVQLFDGLQYRDYTEENQPTGKYYPPFGPHPREKNALMLGLAYNNPFPQVEFNLTLRVPGSDPQATGASCDLPEDKIRPSAILSWEYWDGSGWRVLDLRQDDTRAFTRSGQVYFRGPKDAKPAKLGFFTTADDPELYWLRCRLVQSQYEMAPQLDAVLLNTAQDFPLPLLRRRLIRADALPVGSEQEANPGE